MFLIIDYDVFDKYMWPIRQIILPHILFIFIEMNLFIFILVIFAMISRSICNN